MHEGLRWGCFTKKEPKKKKEKKKRKNKSSKLQKQT
jgi:hypothetical protein